MIDRDLLATCSNTLGLSGHEGAVRALIRQELGHCAELQSYRSGNLHATLKVKKQGPRVLIAAHMDEIGFMVAGITPDGFMPLVPVGGWWNHTLPSQRVIIQTESGQHIRGQIGSKPPHMLPEGERNRVLPDTALVIDIGASSEAEVRALGISEGNAVLPDVQFQALDVEHKLMGKAFDNRVGVYTMIEALRQLAGEELGCQIIGVGTVQEELGTRGAKALGSECTPDLVLVLEGPPADDSYGMPAGQRTGELGKGVQVRLFDPTHLTPPALVSMVKSVAQSEDIPCQFAVRRTGGTDAAASYSNWAGAPAIVLGVPVRYIHAHNGILDERDVSAMLQLTKAILRYCTSETLSPLLEPQP